MPGIPRTLRPYVLFLPLCAGIFVAAGDQTVIVTILPEIMADLRVGAGELDRASWAVTGYLIGYTAAMPLMGRVSDRVGFRMAFLAALAVFSFGSVLVAISPDLPRWLLGQDPEFSWMVTARVVQAVGGGAMIPIAIAAAGDLIPAGRRAVAYGLVGASAEAGGVIGPLWGGAITNVLSWEWAFWLNLPPALVVAVLVARMRRGKRHSVHVDIPGGILFGAALALLTVALTSMDDPWRLAGLSAATAVTIGLLAWHNSRLKSPLFPRSLFRLSNFTSASAAHFMVGAALIIGMVTVPLMATTVMEASPLESGLWLLRMTVGIGIAALVGGAVTQRYGPRMPALAGLVLVTAGFLLMSQWTLEVADPWMTVHLVVTGLGFGLLIAPIIESAMHNVRSEDQGAGSALITVARMIGMTAGLAALSTWGSIRFEHLVAEVPPFSMDPEVQDEILRAAMEAGMTVFRMFFLAAAIICAAAVAPVMVMTRAGRPRQDQVSESGDSKRPVAARF
ncbi:MAG: MFS transporter [Dehalococcoidia bacterium]